MKSGYASIRNVLTFVVFLTVLLFCINTSYFTEDVFFHYFVFCFFAIFVGVVGALKRLNTPIKLSIIELLFLLWAIYVIIHVLFVREGEYYQVSYLLSGIFVAVILSFLFRSERVEYITLYRLFSFVGVFQSVVCILQYVKIISSSSKYYPIIGTFNNPNITAMYVVACIPYFLHNIHLRRRVKLHVVLLLFLLLALVLLKCRTAFAGLAIVLIVYLLNNHKVRNLYNSLRLSTKLYFAAALIVLTCLAGIGFYSLKKDSADGRFFVWKTAINMIKEEPLKGYGYGMFEKEYNLYQAKYFAQSTMFTQEHKNARYVYMPYSDLFEQMIQGGFWGLLLYVLLHVIVVFKAIKSKDFILISIILSTLVMGTINFSQQAIPIWFMFLVTVAYLSSKETVYSAETKTIRYIIALIVFIITVSFAVIQVRKTASHINFSAVKKENNINTRLSVFHRLSKDIGYFEPFHRVYANVLWRSGDKNNAIRELEKAREISSSPSLYTHLARYYFQQGETEKATKLLLTVKNMVPAYFNTRLMLMDIYSATGQHEKERDMALEVMQLPFSNDNKDAIMCRKRAQTILNRESF